MLTASLRRNLNHAKFKIVVPRQTFKADCNLISRRYFSIYGELTVSLKEINEIAWKSSTGFWDRIPSLLKAMQTMTQKSKSFGSINALQKLKENNEDLNTAQILSAFPDYAKLEILQELIRISEQTSILHFLSCCSTDSADFNIPKELSSALLTVFLQKGNMGQLNMLCQLIKYRPNLFSISVGDCNKTIQFCLKSNSLSSAMDWFALIQDSLNLSPTESTYRDLLIYLATFSSWDRFFFVYGDMMANSVVPSKGTMEKIILASTQHASIHWPHLRRLIVDLAAFSKLKQKDSDISTGTAPGAGLSPHNNAYTISLHVLQAVFKALVEEKKWKEVYELYNFLNAKTVAPLAHGTVVTEAAIAAIILRDENFLRMILKNSNEKYSLPSSIGNDLGLYSSMLVAKVAEESTVNFDERVSSIISQHATLITWTFCQNDYSTAVELWNKFIEIPNQIPGDRLNMARHVNDFLLGLCFTIETILSMEYYPMDSERILLQKNATRFLNAVLLSEEPIAGTSDSPGDVPQKIHSQDAKIIPVSGLLFDSILADRLIRLFFKEKDSKAIAAIMAQCIQEKIQISDDSFNLVLQLLNSEGDFRLAIELFELFTKRDRDDGDSQNTAKASESNGEKKVARSNNNEDPICNSFAPVYYEEAVRSYGVVAHFKKIQDIITVELPLRRAILPTPAQIERAMSAMHRKGQYMDAVFLFQRCSAIYKKNAHLLSAALKDENGRFKRIDLAKNWNAPAVMFQNDLHSYDLAKFALRCCAGGKLGFQAMKIYENRQNMFAKGLPKPSTEAMVEELTFLIAALANGKTIGQVISLLQTHQDRTDHPMVSNRLMWAHCVAAAIVADSAPVMNELIDKHWDNIQHLCVSDIVKPMKGMLSYQPDKNSNKNSKGEKALQDAMIVFSKYEMLKSLPQ